ncbi:MFS transporter [Sphingomonas jaspsi]|uniref:MFS transporter n=1 Tax=Sphingomonas jaspsi TaxID=392409 RepID=UPI0004B05CE6|nr:MFS transporter [Sphingomonas jaspsi]
MTFLRQPDRNQPASFLWLYAIAWAGGAVAYVPFLTILLPVRLALIVGDEKVKWLAIITFFGALAASAGGILFGWLSDRSRRRKPWIVAGLLLSVLLLLAVPLAKKPMDLLLLIMCWQLALNMMLSPLAAWAADHVPPQQLGTLGGLLAFSPAMGSIAGAIVTIPGLSGPDGRLVIVALMVVVCVVPALVVGSPVEAVPSGQDQNRQPAVKRGQGLRVGMWLARFLVQISEAALFAYLYYYFRTVDPGSDDATIARTFGIVLSVAVPLALAVGRWADRRDRPILPLIATALAASLGLAGMALAVDPVQATASYVIFGLGSTIFLSLHSAQTLRVLSDPARRGRDLGIFNLTNTAPSLLMPWLTISMVPNFGFSGLFLLLSGLSLAAGILLFAVTRKRSA